MTTPTETGLLSYAKIDGKAFIVDAEGRTLGQVVPAAATQAILDAALGSGIGQTWSYARCWDAMLSAAQVDLTGAVVKDEVIALKGMK